MLLNTNTVKILLLFLSFVSVAYGLELPYVVQVGQLTCNLVAQENSCSAKESRPLLVAEQHGNVCGYRWFDRCDPEFTGSYAQVCVFNRENRLGCGLVNDAVNVIIPLVYDQLRLVEGEQIVAVNYMEKWGYYSLSERRLLFTPQFSYVSDFGDGLAYVIDADEQLADLAWIIDDKGLRVAPVDKKIKVKGYFSSGLIPARLDYYWGYLNKQGSWAIAPQFFAAESFNTGVAAVKYESQPENWAIINTQGAGLIFFEGGGHQLRLRSDNKAELRIGCEGDISTLTENSEIVVTGSSTGSRSENSPGNHECFSICFSPLDKAVESLCDTEKKALGHG
jgi:hypothetical protein